MLYFVNTWSSSATRWGRVFHACLVCGWQQLDLGWMQLLLTESKPRIPPNGSSGCSFCLLKLFPVSYGRRRRRRRLLLLLHDGPADDRDSAVGATTPEMGGPIAEDAPPSVAPEDQGRPPHEGDVKRGDDTCSRWRCSARGQSENVGIGCSRSQGF